ncbi:hypothetical protein Pmar_PMAR019159 [Perkinsus marinus ATCC 50983]|uniref:Uncharacterized protein n=1 Tax=Perkinsus marinus (strain ATCC 50983 / TXsc) TaxID=423536 RepID=C5KU11_PERM5|nr:hypothetical protein Pmar_PMAR019159 [Perkinsus marinus ATCC 50983]EER12053.1 hypothetical protein Pmar_PMAR019159 [Perkinsus marinus ATCC 50983]|eukprot:XP_002780258.1 hypothetical protein Pmar_PMAR019159 [Perkinsus marinus ATCC 50983]
MAQKYILRPIHIECSLKTIRVLEVALVKGKDLQAKEPFVEIYLENHHRRSGHATIDKNSGTVSWENARWALEVTDLASDLHNYSHAFSWGEMINYVPI